MKKITRYINYEDSVYAFANKHCLFAISKTKLREEDGWISLEILPTGSGLTG